MFYDELYELSKKKAKHIIWVLSDLQQGAYEQCYKCLQICKEDYALLNHPAELILYLGDAVEGTNLEEIEKMVKLQEDYFSSLNIPLCYATGNHDYDLSEKYYKNGEAIVKMPFYEMVKKHSNWHCTNDVGDIYFTYEIDKNFILYIFSDHVSNENKWCSTHSYYRYGKENYPYTDDDFKNISKLMHQDQHKYIITASHYGFPGGNRDTYLMSKLQPLPINTKIHLYGHSHVGEYRCPQERVFSSIQWVDWQDIPQIDVASFENIRGSYCKSVILHLYEDGSVGAFFRNHDEHKFVQAFFSKAESSEVEGMFEQYNK